MKRIMAVGLQLLFLFMLTTTSVPSQEIVTTKDGKQIQLNKDGTWTELRKEVVTTKDGKHVQLNPDGTWTEVKAPPANRGTVPEQRPVETTSSKNQLTAKPPASLGAPTGGKTATGKDIYAGAHVGIEKKVKDIIIEQLGVDESEVTRTARFVEDLGADSLDMVELTMVFEEAFDVEISDKDAEKIRTMGDAIDYIKSHAKRVN